MNHFLPANPWRPQPPVVGFDINRPNISPLCTESLPNKHTPLSARALCGAWSGDASGSVATVDTRSGLERLLSFPNLVKLAHYRILENIFPCEKNSQSEK